MNNWHHVRVVRTFFLLLSHYSTGDKLKNEMKTFSALTTVQMVGLPEMGTQGGL